MARPDAPPPVPAPCVAVDACVYLGGVHLVVTSTTGDAAGSALAHRRWRSFDAGARGPISGEAGIQLLRQTTLRTGTPRASWAPCSDRCGHCLNAREIRQNPMPRPPEAAGGRYTCDGSSRVRRGAVGP